MRAAACAKTSERVGDAKAPTPARRAASGLWIDAFERDADRVPQAVMAGDRAGPQWSFARTSIGAPLQRKCSCEGSSGAVGGCEECRKKSATLQRASRSSRGTGIESEDEVPPVVHEVLRSPGEPLDAVTRAFFESRFGHRFGQVRVHADARAARSARAVNALAYTVGPDVVFGAGLYGEGALNGQRLLAHELSHVVQQKSIGPTPPAALKIVDDLSAEREADQSADRIVQGDKTVSHNFGSLSLGLQRQAKPTDVGLKVVGHGASADAVNMATERLFEVLGGLGAPKETALKGTSVELHIIPHDKKLTDLPEFASLRGKTTFDGRNYDDLRGVGGTKIGNTIRYAVAEEQLVSITGKPSGYSGGFVAAHESGHIVEQFGLTPDQQKALQKAFDVRKRAGGPWLNPRDYTSSRVGEYFAQCVSAYFNRPYSDSEEDKRMYTRVWLIKNDPEMYELLISVYSSPRQLGDFPERLMPAGREAV